MASLDRLAVSPGFVHRPRQAGYPATTTKMASHRNWAGLGPAGPNNGASPAAIHPNLLDGMTLLDSPFPNVVDFEMPEDDYDLESFMRPEAEGTPGFSQQAASLDDMNDFTHFENTMPVAAPAVDFSDFQLYPDDNGDDPTFGLDPADFDLGFGLNLSASVPAPSPMSSQSQFPSPVDTSPTFSSSGFYSAHASPFGQTPSPASSGNGFDTAVQPHLYPYQCTTDGCPKRFRKESQLKQHQRVHRKSFVCQVCSAEGRVLHRFAQTRDLERHLQARHPDAAERSNVRSEVRDCPAKGCDYRARRDNVSRHHESKHGGRLKWRKGVASIV